MKKVIIATILMSVLIYAVASARVVIIPSDYPTIQEGINSCSQGDTVLVEPGIYYENINFNGHNIVVASFYLIDRNPARIIDTIIDGDSSGSVVTFENGEDNTTIITGFTLKNGYYIEGGGIYCEGSGPVIYSNIISENSVVYYHNGGGIYCSNSNAIIIDNTIVENHACHGGGIYCENSNIIIRNNIIADNEANP